MDETDVELDVVREDVMLIADTNAVTDGLSGSSKKKLELIKLHLKRDGTSVISFEKVFKRDSVRLEDKRKFEELLDIALKECDMTRHDFSITSSPSANYGAVERECKTLTNLIVYLEFWGSKTQKYSSDYTLDNHEALCFHIEGILCEHLSQVNRESNVMITYMRREDYHLDLFLDILHKLKKHWIDLDFSRKCRLSNKCRELQDEVMREGPVESQKCCESCCIL